jgi:hypothetical protein
MTDLRPDSPPDSSPERGRLQRLLEWLRRHRFVLAPITFAAGIASFLLFQRQERVAQVLAVLLVLSWLLMLLEAPLARWQRLTPGLLRFLVQAIHQEAFFFSLPFFFATTTWSSGQAGFTALLTLAGICTLWDPLYFGQIAKRRWLYLAFHALAIFAALLVALPMLLHLTTTQSLALSCAAMAVFAVPSLAHVIARQTVGGWLLLVASSITLGVCAWLLRPFVPPATLWVHLGLITDTVDTASKTPGVEFANVPAAQAHNAGLYAYTAIRAPRGLRERVFHVWLHEGIEVDRIPLEIVGGREDGYRAWSHKQGFPADARGEWQVDVITEGGQLIGRVEFEVIGELPLVLPPAEPLPPPEAAKPPLPDQAPTAETPAPVEPLPPAPAEPAVEPEPQAAPEPETQPEEEPQPEPESEPSPEPEPVSPVPSEPESSSP